MHTGLPTQPAVKLPALAHPVTAVAFAPAECDSYSAAEGRGRDLLAVGLENGALQLWGLHKSVTASASAHIGNLIIVRCCGLALLACTSASKAVQKPQGHASMLSNAKTSLSLQEQSCCGRRLITWRTAQPSGDCAGPALSLRNQARMIRVIGRIIWHRVARITWCGYTMCICNCWPNNPKMVKR